MKIFGINVQTKKELRARIAELEAQNAQVRKYNEDIANEYEKIRTYYPLDIGVTMYDVQLKNKNGKFTTVKPSKEHSVIIPVVVTEKNYFRLAKKFMSGVFYKKEEAEEYLDKICSK